MTAPDIRTPARAPRVAPLLALLRTTLAEHGEVTFRLLPAGEVDDWNPRVTPHERVVELPEDFDDVRFLTTVVYGLLSLDMAGEDPRLAWSTQRFIERAVAVAVGRMGEVAR